MSNLVRVIAAALLGLVLGCVHPQGERPGAQTPHGRAVPPEQAVHMQTDGPTQPRQSAARPPDREEDPPTRPGVGPEPTGKPAQED